MTKREFLKAVANGLTHEQVEAGSDLWLALLAYEEFGSNVRDNSFEDLVSIGRDLEEEG